MAGSKFQYDESGGTFFYFLLAFLFLVLVPSTFYVVRGGETEPKVKSTERCCKCEKCENKRRYLRRNIPRKRAKRTAIIGLLVIGWCAFFYVLYIVMHLQIDHVDWNPFDILQIDRESSQAEIKKAYRKLSLIYHPDKETGNDAKFMQLTKAYAALTDDEARKNWEMYGNPDGPGAMTFGIALPSWIVEKENSVFVLGIYIALLLVALPVVVGVWWYRSIKYGAEQVLMDTIQIYYYFFHHSPHMVVKRVLMVLAASWEFEKNHNSEVVERPTDNIEIPSLFKELPNLGEKNKEQPLCFPYSLKARSLLHAHLHRICLPENTLDIDRLYIIKKCPLLIQEMIQIISQLTAFFHAGRISRKPSIETLENAMKLSAMIVQAIWESKSPLFQLPHFDEEKVRHLRSRRSIQSIQQLVKLSPEDRRNALKDLTDAEYNDILTVCEMMPDVKMSVKVEVLDDENPGEIAAGDIVTVTVKLTRNSLYNRKNELNAESLDRGDGSNQIKKIGGAGGGGGDRPVWQSKKNKAKSWQKKGKKQSGGGQPREIYRKIVTHQETTKVENLDGHSKSETTPKSNREKKRKTSGGEGAAEDQGDSESDLELLSDESESHEESSSNKQSNNVSSSNNGQAANNNYNDEDDADWERLQSKISRREKILEGKSKKSHSVHSPYFSEEKQEYWWLYIIDRKSKSLVTTPYHITDLIRESEVPLRFAAPPKADKYHYIVHLKSDSYLDCDRTDQLVLDVRAARKEQEISHPQWDISEDEKEKQDETGDSDLTTDDEVVTDSEEED